MQVLTAEETQAAIEKAVAPLLRELATLRRLVVENGEWVTAEQAKKMTGLSDNRILKKYIEYVQKGEGGKLSFSKSSILEYLEKNKIAA